MFREGDDGGTVFVLLAGQVKLSVSALSGKDVILAVRDPREILGEIAAIDGARDLLSSVKLGEELQTLRDATLALDRATQRLAELMMDAAVTTAIRGKTMHDAGEELGNEVTAPHPMAPAEFK